ncbi:MAG: glycoside hydrolase family 32 protein [Planctomycetota bacterium]
MSSRQHRRAVRKATRTALAGAERAANDPHRPAYHFVPPSGWMNDPNGLIRWRGRYHLFYQHNPCAPDWGTMHWGHAVSEDLVHWRHRSVALAPSEPYDLPAEGGGGCFSGSAVDDDGRLTLIYTGTSDHNPRGQAQCVAFSDDGERFTKYSGNPVIPAPPPEGSGDFRDPKVWRHGGSWYMVVGSGRDGVGKALLYRSDDLREWDYVGVAAESGGELGRVWECPDLFPLGDRHLLVISPIGVERRKSVTLVGDFDHEAGRFRVERRRDTDYGPGFYAPQSFLDEDGRRVMFGWMLGGGEQCPNKEYGWQGAQTLPRVVQLLPDGGVGFRPVPELAEPRGEHHCREDITVEPGSELVVKEARGDALELSAHFTGADRADARFGLAMRCGDDGEERTAVLYDGAERTVTLDLDRSGRAADGRFAAPVGPLEGGRLGLRAFVDRSSVEVFVNRGRAVLPAPVWPHPSSLGVRLLAGPTPAHLSRFEAWKLEDIWR